MQYRTDTPVSALWKASHAGDRTIVSHLICEGVDVNTWDEQGYSALTFAARAGHCAIVCDLLKAGARIDSHEDGDGFMTPLMCAAQQGNLEMVVLLLKEGADPTRFGGYSFATADHYARVDSPDKKALSTLLREAEDAWRRRTK